MDSNPEEKTDATVTLIQKQQEVLQDSLFVTSVELGRYQMTLEILKDGDKKKFG